MSVWYDPLKFATPPEVTVGGTIPGKAGEDFGIVWHELDPTFNGWFLLDPKAAARGLNNPNPNYRRARVTPPRATWKCDYCNGSRSADALTCSGCGASRP